MHAPAPTRRPLQPAGGNRLRLAVIVLLLALAFVVSQTCQRQSTRVNKDQAIATAKSQVDFNPRRTQIRFLRRGLNSKPYWIVSLSVPGRREGTFRELAVVTIDANSGKVTQLADQHAGRH
jgi:hypothetical protein